jgi:hypothetical protein
VAGVGAISKVLGVTAILVCVVGVGTAAAKRGMAGSYRGTTSQGLPISFTIAKGKTRLAKISVKETPFECPERTTFGLNPITGQLEPFLASKAGIGPKGFGIGAGSQE